VTFVDESMVDLHDEKEFIAEVSFELKRSPD
jgi:hypothetical protein